METKGGSVQALHLYDLTGQHALDLVVGDSDGVITMFSRQQILSKQEIGSAVTTIDIFKDLGKWRAEGVGVQQSELTHGAIRAGL